MKQRDSTAQPSDSEDPNKIFVGGVPTELTEERLKEYFYQYGEVSLWWWNWGFWLLVVKTEGGLICLSFGMLLPPVTCTTCSTFKT